MSGDEIDVEGLRRMLDDAQEAWLWHEMTDDTMAGYGYHMSQMLHRLPVDGQTRDMKTSIEGLIDALAVALDEVEALRGQVERVRALALGAKEREAASLSRTFGGGTFGAWVDANQVLAALDGPR